MTLDVAVILPERIRTTAIQISHELASLMDRSSRGAAFRLGDPFPGDGHGGACEPHVSLFMMAVEQAEVPDVIDALARLAPHLAPVDAIGTEYRFNHEGAPEVFYERSDDWRRLQRAIVADVEPLRRGRLREIGPGGERLAEIASQLDPDDPARVRQLVRYGYDDVSDDADDRLNPHITLTWPTDPDFRVDLGGLPPVTDFSGRLAEFGLFGMSPNGTCTREHGRWAFGEAVGVDAGKGRPR